SQTLRMRSECAALHHDAQPFRHARDARVEPPCARVLERKAVVAGPAPSMVETQRTFAATPGQISVNLRVPLSSLRMTCAYVGTIERRREISILAATPNRRATPHNSRDAR